MQNGIVHEKGSDRVRLTISKSLKAFMAKEYEIYEDYLFLENEIFRNIDSTKQIKLYEPKDNIARVIVIYEIPDVKMLEYNGHYLSIDLGVKNPFTCYDSEDNSFIVGKRFLSILHYYDKKIAYFQSISSCQQLAAGIRYPKPSKRILALYVKKRNDLNDYFRKCKRHIADYCRNNGIDKVIIGDITGIRKGYDKGDRLNQQFHSLPYAQIYTMLEYKLKLYGITLIKQNGVYSSQVSPLAEKVCRENTYASGRVKRGLYMDGNSIYNADAVGACNILRLYTGRSYPNKSMTNPTKVAV